MVFHHKSAKASNLLKSVAWVRFRGQLTKSERVNSTKAKADCSLWPFLKGFAVTDDDITAM